MDAALADLLACVAAVGRSLHTELDPQRSLLDFSARVQRLVPHDRMLVAYRERETRTFTVFVEEAGQGPPLHRGRYTTDFDPGGRYALEDWGLGPVFEGSGLFMEDVTRTPRWPRRWRRRS
jgi:hypothetical protein